MATEQPLPPASREVVFASPDGSAAILRASPDSFHPVSLFGLASGLGGREVEMWKAAGPAVLSLGQGLWQAGEFRLVEAVEEDALVWRATWSTPRAGVLWQSRWSFDPVSGVLSRRDALLNHSTESLTVHRCAARIGLAAEDYEVYLQSSRWAMESQGRWVPLHTGALTIGSDGGRTTESSTPYLALRPEGGAHGLVAHLVPRGDWQIRLAVCPGGNGQAFLSLEAGPAEADLHRAVASGERYDLPELLLQALPEGRPERAAPRLHRFLRRHRFASAKPHAPVVYNTWIDCFDHLEVPRLRAQLQAAQTVGAEVFVIDAGWYGAETDTRWFDSAGDWREAPGRAFHGRMAEFADEVRAAGLQFGLWIEPEHVGPRAPLRAEHPEWMVGGRENPPRLDLEQPAARAWLRGEIDRLIATYRLAWLKVDFNIHLGKDPRGAALEGYFEAWHGLLADLRQAHPGVFFEGCSSGGMRLEMASQPAYDMHFLSDTCHPVDVLRLSEGSLLRLLPGRLGKWVVLRSIGRAVPAPDGVEFPEAVVSSPAAGWQSHQVAETVDPDFAMLVGLTGMMGFSGDLAGCSRPMLERLAGQVAFYRSWRDFLAAAEVWLLTPVRPLGDRSGWSVQQYASGDGSRSLVFAFRLQDRNARRRFPLHDLDPQAEYTVRFHPAAGDPRRCSGADLLRSGVEFLLPQPGSAAVAIVEETHQAAVEDSAGRPTNRRS